MKTTHSYILVLLFSSLQLTGQISSSPQYRECGSFVFSESFSSTVPDGWTGDFDSPPGVFLEGWILNSDSTETQMTGPEMAFDGDYYLYLETSGPAPINSTYQVTSPMISLSTSGEKGLYFHTLMYGDETGSLTINAITSAGTDQLLVINGEQHSDGSQSNWEEVFVDLSGYNGQDIQIQFVGMKATGNMGDIAIDTIQICELRSIPTLNQWGLIILGLTLSILSINTVKSNQKRTQLS